ncbi:MAG: mannose-1-phosphate guanylyltransferase [Candidatus Eisenbacteria bacterium]|nr:mannose-1-phosphate guanylyltransferase [Candidatus Eisenbacteria bacterium]
MSDARTPDTFALILAGGRGERFWPLSSAGRPKQFLKLAGEETLLTRTARRVEPLIPLSQILVVTGRDQVDLVRESLPDLAPENVIGEPVGRNTAPAVALGALWAERRHPGARIVVMPSDAWVGDDAAYRAALSRALDYTGRHAALGTIGIVPSRPETGYGYLEVGAPLEAAPGLHRVDRFVEKPDAGTAATWLTGGRHLWNGGIFVMRASVLLGAVRTHLPGVDGPLQVLANRTPAGRPTFEAAMLAEYYAAVPSISIDYGVMEKSDNVVTVTGAFPWDDLGAWSALERVLPPLGDVTAVGKTLGLESPGAILFAAEGLVATLGMPDVIVVRTGNAVLVLPKSRAQEVRRLVQAIEARDDLAEFR